VACLIAFILSVTSRTLDGMEQVPEYSAKVRRVRNWLRFRRAR
jgi:hypothetical protein